MFRPLVSVALACVLGLAAAVAPPASPARAGEGDVFAARWITRTVMSNRVSTAASVTPSATSGGLSASSTSGGVTRSVSLHPPTDKRFVAGTTYVAASAATATSARLAMTGMISTISCTFAGRIRVRQAEYDDAGVLTAFAADYDATCATSTAVEEAVGSVRFASTVPYGLAVPSYPAVDVAIGRESITTATVTGHGRAPVTLGGATLGGARANDYRVVGNRCLGVVLTGGESCQVDVAFAPEQLSSGGQGARVAELGLATTGEVADKLRVRLASRAIPLPGTPTQVTDFPVQEGLGLTWRAGHPEAPEYRVEKRGPGETTWTKVATVPYASSSPYVWVDSEVPPGGSASYRVTGVNTGWAGPSVELSAARPETVAVPGEQSLVAFDSDVEEPTVIRSSDPTATVRGQVQTYPSVYATRDDPRASATFFTPVVPGPGEYRKASGLAGSMSSGQASYNCSTVVDAVLRVRQVAYDESVRPLVFDASYTGWCAGGTMIRMEIRLGVDDDYALTEATPSRVGRLTTYAGRVESTDVTVTNSGPDTLLLGAADVRGEAAEDWRVTGSTCEGSLAPAESCTVDLAFSSTADGPRPARLELAARDSGGPVAPQVVLLDGLGATPPSEPTFVNSAGTIGAVATWWRPPLDNGGYPVLSYDLQRKRVGGTYQNVATLGVADREYVDGRVKDGDGYTYRVRARNQVGAGSWKVSVSPETTTFDRAVVVSGEHEDGGPHGLFVIRDFRYDVPERALDTDGAYDHRDPATSPAGTRLAYSRSSSPGNGANGEYDLWTGTIESPAGARLTSMPGSERHPAWSPDASRIAFTHVALDGSRSVWLVPAAGGRPELLVDGAASPTWTEDGTAVVVEDDSSDGPLLQVALDGTSMPIAGTEGGSEPAVSRAGRIAYVDVGGRIVELTPGSAAPEVVHQPRSEAQGNPTRLSAPAYGSLGDLFFQITTLNTGRPTVYHREGKNTLASGAWGMGEPSPVVVDRNAPWIWATGMPEHVRGSLTVTVGVSDHDETPEVALRSECRLDGAAWKPCRGEVRFAGLADGRHGLGLRVTDEAGRVTSYTEGFVSDTTPPSVSVVRPSAAAELGASAGFVWDGKDRYTEVRRYDVTVRRGSPTRALSTYRRPDGWPTWSTRTRLAVTLVPGEEVCLRVRARDAAGNRSGYRSRCVAKPLDDRALVTAQGWRRTRTSNAWRSTVTSSTVRGATLRSSDAVSTRRVGILATTCPECGTVKVWVGSRYVGVVELRSTRTRYRQMRYLPLLPRTVTGRLTLRTTSGRPVAVDGVLLRRT